ncbi:hypothetical protein L345_18574, partial [Ophiophagus hannah]
MKKGRERKEEGRKMEEKKKEGKEGKK